MIRRRHVLGIVVALAALVVPAPPSASGQTAIEVSLASQTPVVRPGGDFVMRVGIDGVDIPPRPVPTAPDDTSEPDEDGAAPEPVGGPTVTVQVHERVTSRSAFDLTTDGTSLGRVLFEITAPVALLDAGPAGARTIRIPVSARRTAADQLVLPREGVYPVSVDVDSDDDDLVPGQLVTHLIRAPGDDVDPLLVAMVLSMHRPPVLAADGTTVSVPGGTFDEAADLLVTLPAVPVVLAPTPEALRATADDAPEVLERLRDRTNVDRVLVRPWVLIDPRAASVTSLADQLRVGADVTAELLGPRPGTRTWLATAPLDGEALSRLRSVGVDQVVATRDVATAPDRALTLTDLVELEGARLERLRAVVAEPVLAERLLDGEPVLAAHRFLADLAVLLFDEPGRQRGVAVVWDDEMPSAPAFEVVLGALRDSPIARPVGVSELFRTLSVATDASGAPVVADLVEGDAPDVVDTTELADHIAVLTDMAGPGIDIIESFTTRLLTSAATDLPVARDVYLAELDAAVDTELDRLATTTQRSFTLTARTGELPVTIRNEASYAVDVVVTLDSDKLLFPSSHEQAVRLEPGNTTVTFTVEARSSGTFPLRVEILSPDRALVLDTSRVTVRSTVVSGVGLALTIGSLLFLVVWWGSHLRRRGDHEIVITDLDELGDLDDDTPVDDV